MMMTARPTLKLMSTEGCSLCDAALDLLFSMPELAGWKLSVVDIAAFEGGIETYGARIPVLTAGRQELDGPLTGERIRIWLKQLRLGD